MSCRTRQDAFLGALIEWLNRKLVPPGVTVDADTPLFEARLIDSIRILELIAWTERATETVIPDRMIRMDYFETPRKIAETFASDDCETIATGAGHVGNR